VVKKEKDFWYWHSEEGRKEIREALEKIFNNPIPKRTRELEQEILGKIRQEEEEEWEEHKKMIDEMMKL